MGKRLYVGNIPFTTTEDQVRAFFAPRHLTEVRLINDRDTGRPRGYGFVELATDAEADEAIATLDGESMGGRAIVVNVANERPAASGGARRAERGGQRSRRETNRDYE
jgi:RNA recognition motif-containing protein